MLQTADGVQRAYAAGVTMGDDVRLAETDGGAPKFLLMALSDPRSAPLQRLQVIKGWVDASGETHEEVIDVACAKGAAVDPDTNRCPDNGARVDISTCAINPAPSQETCPWRTTGTRRDRAGHRTRSLAAPPQRRLRRRRRTTLQSQECCGAQLRLSAERPTAPQLVATTSRLPATRARGRASRSATGSRPSAAALGRASGRLPSGGRSIQTCDWIVPFGSA